MRMMYEFMQEKIKMSKETAALLTAVLLVIGVVILTAAFISVIGLWCYADTILSLVSFVSGVLVLIWILNL